MSGSLTEIKTAIAWGLRELIGDDRFELWFSADQSICLKGDSVVIGGNDEFSLSFIRQQFQKSLREVVDAALGPQTPIRFEILVTESSSSSQQVLFNQQQLSDAGLEHVSTGRTAKRGKVQRRCQTSNGSESPVSRKPAESRTGDPKLATPFAARPRLEDFQFGASNSVLQSAIDEVLVSPGKFNPLVLHGPVGSGKTHLLQAIVARARRRREFKHCVYMTSEQFTSSFLEGLHGNGLTTFRAKYRNLDLFAIDDIQFLSGKRATLVEFQNTIESLLRTGRQIVTSSDRPVFESGFLGDEMITRLSCGLACSVEYPDFTGRLRIVQCLVEQKQLNLKPGVLELVARRIGRDVRLLAGAVNRIKAASLVDNHPISEQAVEHLLSDFFQAQHPIVSMAKIEQVVCDMCGVESKELKSATRVKRVCTARMLAMWLSRKHTSAALAEIGEYYGGRSHSTVVAAEKKINQLLAAQQPIELRSQRCNIDSAVNRLEYNLRVG